MEKMVQFDKLCQENLRSQKTSSTWWRKIIGILVSRIYYHSSFHGTYNDLRKFSVKRKGNMRFRRDTETHRHAYMSVKVTSDILNSVIVIPVKKFMDNNGNM